MPIPVNSCDLWHINIQKHKVKSDIAAGIQQCSAVRKNPYFKIHSDISQKSIHLFMDFFCKYIFVIDDCDHNPMFQSITCYHSELQSLYHRSHRYARDSVKKILPHISHLRHSFIQINRYIKEGRKKGSDAQNEIERATHYF